METIQLNIDGTLYETQANRTFKMRNLAMDALVDWAVTQATTSTAGVVGR